MKEYRKKEFISKSSRGEYCSEECKKAKIPTSEHLGEKWGELTILSAYRIVGRLYAECECSCGKPCTVRYEDAADARKEAEKYLYKDFLKWYAEAYPDRWKKLQKNTPET